MEYLATWRMALSKALLLRGEASVSDVAKAVGYGSARAFWTAFTRHDGIAPARDAEALRAPG